MNLRLQEALTKQKGNQMNSVSVKVMRSFDYCHFEIGMTVDSDENGNPVNFTSEIIDELRKKAARLADKAVEQYKIAKTNLAKREGDATDRIHQEWRMRNIESLPETERTPEEQAALKAFKDTAWQNRRHYDYEEDWQEQE